MNPTTQAKTPKSFQDIMNEKNAAYAERNKVVAALCRFAQSSGYKVGIGPHEPADDQNWDPAWKQCVFIDLPTGQVSWHFHRDDIPLFSEFGAYGGKWDQHSTQEKYNRLAAFRPDAVLEMAKNALYSLLSSKAHHFERAVATQATNFMEAVNDELARWAGRKK